MIFDKKGNPVDINKEFQRLRAEEPIYTNQRAILRASIMGYELGDIQKFATKNAQEHLDVKLKKALEANAKLGMADLLAQLRMFCLDMGWDYDEIQLMGLEHLKERHEDFKKDGYAEK